jgi:hypothetical protein
MEVNETMSHGDMPFDLRKALETLRGEGGVSVSEEPPAAVECEEICERECNMKVYYPETKHFRETMVFVHYPGGMLHDGSYGLIVDF